MQVKNILSRLSDATRFGQNRDALESVARKAVDPSGKGAAAASTSTGRLREILAGYDVTNITPKTFSEMLQKLQQSGLLPEKDMQELSQIRTDMEQDGVGTDQSVNLLDIYAKKLKAAEQEASGLADKLAAADVQGATTSLRRRLDWLEKFAAIHASPEASTINALA
jgi:hypothetical protein